MTRINSNLAGNDIFMLFSDLFLCLCVVLLVLITPAPPVQSIDAAGVDSSPIPTQSLYLYLGNSGDVFSDSEYNRKVQGASLNNMLDADPEATVVLVARQSVPISSYLSQARALKALDRRVSVLMDTSSEATTQPAME